MYDFIFRFDANETSGAGHFQRINALIQKLLLKSLRIACVGSISDKFKDIQRSSVAIGTEEKKMGDQKSIDDLLADLGL